jgi:Tfp pilus assembly protein PilN
MAEERLTKVQSRVDALSQPDQALATLGGQKAVVYGKATELEGILGARTRWLSILKDLHDTLIPGMWLTSVRPIAPPDEKSGPRLEVRGMAFSDEVNNQAINEYTARLKGMGYFTEDLKIKWVKPVAGTDYATEFAMEMGLADKPALPVAAAPEARAGGAGNGSVTEGKQ